MPIILPKISNEKISSFHLYVVKLNKSLTNLKRDFIINHLRKKKIATNLHYIPIYRHSFYKQFNYNKKNFPNCEEYYKNAISIPLFPEMTKKIQDRIIKEIRSIFDKKT